MPDQVGRRVEVLASVSSTRDADLRRSKAAIEQQEQRFRTVVCLLTTENLSANKTALRKAPPWATDCA